MQYLTNSCSESLFLQLVNLFVDELNNLLKKQDNVCVALPGGRSILSFLRVLDSQLATKSNNIFDPSRIHFYLTDERVTTNTDDLNEKLLNQNIFDNPDTPYKTFFDLGNRFNEYNYLFATPDMFFDFVFLGVGEDGHIASIFPEQNNALLSEAYYLKVNSLNKPPPERITLSQKAILEANNIIVLFIDEHKRQALTNFQNNKISAEKCPAKLVLQQSEKVRLVSNI